MGVSQIARRFGSVKSLSGKSENTSIYRRSNQSNVGKKKCVKLILYFFLFGNK